MSDDIRLDDRTAEAALGDLIGLTERFDGLTGDLKADLRTDDARIAARRHLRLREWRDALDAWIAESAQARNHTHEWTRVYPEWQDAAWDAGADDD